MIKILFNVIADNNNTNAQSLNARDIALRLAPEIFESSMFVLGQPDPRLLNRRNIRLIQLPPRMGSLAIAAYLIWGNYDVVFYPPHDRVRIFYPTLSWMGKRKKVIATVEGTAEAVQDVSREYRERFLRMLEKADACYAISPYIAESMLREFGIEMEVIPIGVDTTVFRATSRVDHLPPTKVLFVGSLQPRKQVGLILDLARWIGPQEAEFHIIGAVINDPSYRESLLQRKADEKLDHVYFHGKQLQAEVGRWMHQCDVFVLPSRLEGTPKVLFEAAATGLPCVVFDDYQTPCVVDSVTGFQVKTFEEMKNRLGMLIESPDLRLKMGAAGAQHAKKFDWGVVVKQWEDVFEKAIAGRN